MEKIGKIVNNLIATLHESFISADSIIPLLDNSPVNLHNMFSGSLRQRLCSLKSLLPILKMGIYVNHTAFFLT